MNKLIVNTDSKTYPIYFTEDFSGLRSSIEAIGKNYSSYIIISDSNVSPLYSEQIKEELASVSKKILLTTFDAGEENKKLETVMGFYSDMIEFGADRKSLVIALGGGVTGDMAGFCAATYMRGIDFIQVPTSLLSQVDSSVGGKTGIDFNGYKNVVGAFYQPELVYINVNTLTSLPPRELYAGMSEVVKHAFIKDVAYYEFLVNSVDKVLSLESESLKKMIEWSCSIKKGVVDEDEKEQGVRALLNFGHTFGHSIERLKNFELIHGECVAIGMHAGFKLANRLNLIDHKSVNLGLELIESYKMPMTLSGLTVDEIYDEMFHDKKTTNNRLVFALLDGIGNSHLSTEQIDETVIKSCIKDIIAD